MIEMVDGLGSKLKTLATVMSVCTQVFSNTVLHIREMLRLQLQKDIAG